MAVKPRVVAAIDFGTYGSGYAWMVVDPRIQDPAGNEIIHNKNWPGNVDVSAAKTRTALLVDKGSISACGSEVYQEYKKRRVNNLPLGVLIEDFKVMLKSGRSGYQIDKNDRAVLGLKRAGMSVDKAVAAYLKWIYGRALNDMRRSGITPGDVEWCLTVPAIWAPAEKDRMRAAATAAGIPDERLVLALEPEAAAIHVYLTHGRLVTGTGTAALDLVRPGTRFMVVDGGGGTVDITAYRVADEGGLAEIGRAKGERLGADYLNQGFMDVVSRHLGGSSCVLELENADPVGFSDLTRRWEDQKRHVRFDQEDPVEVAFGARIDRAMSPAMRQSLARTQSGIDDTIVLSPEEIKGIFAAVVDPTLKYIDDQLAEMASFTHVRLPTETIVLDGGFSASPYLQEAIQRRFVGRAAVITSLHPETAVLHGAVHFARDPEITRVRRVQYTWGINVTEDFDANIHDVAHRKRIGGRWACDDIFSIFVRDGDPVSPDEPVVHDLSPYTASQNSITLDLYSTKSRKPKHVDDAGCTMTASITVPIRNMKHLPREQRLIDVAMYFGRTELEVHATNSLSGETQRIRVKYSYTFDS